MRVHLTGEIHGSIRLAACKNVPAACKEFYLAERDREAAKSREKEAACTELYKKKKAMEEEHCKDANPRTLSMTNQQQDVG